MKRTVSVLLALVMCLGLLHVPAPAAHAAGGVAINETNFPDAAFRNHVAENYDTDGSGVISAEEIEAAVVLYVYGEGITSLQGVEYLTSLKELACTENQLTELDLSRNTALEAVFCDNNQLTALDVSGCSALWLLHCYDNSLTELDVSRNRALEYLACFGNQRTTLDISHCPCVLKAVTGGTKSDEGDWWRYQYETPDAYWFSLYLLDVDKTVELITAPLSARRQNSRSRRQARA